MKKFKNIIANILRFIFSRKPKDFYDIPIIINNYNRLTTLKKLLDALDKRGYRNILILDNQSTYPPLLNFYKNTDYNVHILKKNYGSKSLWKSNLWLKFMFSNFAYTDSDVLPLEECPSDFMEYFYSILEKHPTVHKVGFSLKIDDLPNYYDNKEKVITWESNFYKNEIAPNLYQAPIDTTFALYRPFSKSGKRDGSTEIIRTGAPYQARHLPWYINSNNLDEEEEYYVKSITTRTHWSRQNK